EFNWTNQDDLDGRNGTIKWASTLIVGQDGSHIRIVMVIPATDADTVTGTFSAILYPSVDQPGITMEYRAADDSSSRPATATDMMQVLGLLDSFRLSGDIRYGDEYTRIEDVSITPICFTSGTLIATPDGERAVETLRPGDLVMTRDHGPQELRWVGMRVMRSEEHTSELQSRENLVCRLLLEKKKHRKT